MAVHAGCFSTALDPGITRATQARRTCRFIPPQKSLIYWLYISLSACALLTNAASATMDLRYQTLYDQGYPPFFQGKEPSLQDARNHRPVSFVSRRRHLFTVPREHLVLEYDEGLARHKKQQDARPPPAVRQQETTPAPPAPTAPVEKPALEPVPPEGPKETAAEKQKTVKELKKKKTKGAVQMQKKTKSLGMGNPPQKGETDRVALLQGLVGAAVVLICLLTVRPPEAIPLLRFGVSTAAAAWAYAKLSEWYKSRRQTK